MTNLGDKITDKEVGDIFAERLPELLLKYYGVESEWYDAITQKYQGQRAEVVEKQAPWKSNTASSSSSRRPQQQ